MGTDSGNFLVYNVPPPPPQNLTKLIYDKTVSFVFGALMLLTKCQKYPKHILYFWNAGGSRMLKIKWLSIQDPIWDPIRDTGTQMHSLRTDFCKLRQGWSEFRLMPIITFVALDANQTYFNLNCASRRKGWVLFDYKETQEMNDSWRLDTCSQLFSAQSKMISALSVEIFKCESY